jgi:multiple sugar transport system substrate-binding protein
MTRRSSIVGIVRRTIRHTNRARAATALGLAGVVALAMTGCASGGSSAGSDQTKGATITVAFTSVRPPARLLAEFKKKTGITVKWTTTDWDNLQTKITAGASAKTYYADVTDVDWSRVGQFAKLGWFHDMSDLLDTGSMASDMPQLDAFTVKKDVVGIPMDASFMVSTVNRAQFEKAGITTMPTTMDEYTADLKTLQDKGVADSPLNIPFAAAEGLSTYWYQTTAAFGGTVLTKDQKPAFSSPQSGGYKAAEWMVQMMKDGIVPAGNVNATDSQGSQTLMATGKVASTFSDYSGNVGTLYEVPDTSTVVGDVEYIPTPTSGGASKNLDNPDGMGVPTTAKYPKAAAEFIKWFTSSSVQARMAGAGDKDEVLQGYALPSRVSAIKTIADSDDLAKGKQLQEMFENNTQPIFPAGAPTWYAAFSKAVYTNLHAAASGEKTVAQAMAAITSTAKSLQAGS